VFLESGACPEGCSDYFYWDFAYEGGFTMRAHCETADGEIVEQEIVSAPLDLPGPDVSLTVGTDALPAGGGDTEVCWSSTGADGCQLDGEPVALSGCETRTFAADTEVRLDCYDGVGWSNARKHVMVGVGIRSFALDERLVFRDERGVVVLSWEAVDATSCILNGSWLPDTNVEPTGSLEIELPDYGPGTYVNGFNLFCSDADGPPEGQLGDVYAYAEVYIAQ
jgi:hypothetical protein